MEEEPGMSGPKQRRKVTGDEEEAFPRHTQVLAKEGSCRRRRKCQKNGEAGFGED